MTNSYKKLCNIDIPGLVTAFKECGWSKPARIFKHYLQEQDNNERMIWVARNGTSILGYITLKWHSEYPFFKKNNIPEIKDLNVLPHCRNQGIGSQLLDIAEQAAFKHSGKVGIGVGLYADYGAAQRLYVKRAYLPDGKGVTYKHRSVLPGARVTVNDELVVWMVKERP